MLDRGYISSEWWNIINNSKAFFITRNFKHFSYKTLNVLYDVSNSNNIDNSNNINNTNTNNTNNELINSLPESEIIQDCIIQANGDKFKKFYKDKLRLVIVKRDRTKHLTDLKFNRLKNIHK